MSGRIFCWKLMNSTDHFIQKLPKAELHLHIEGTLEPELLFDLARRNGKRIRFASVGELRKAYQFSDLQDFLDIYYEGTNVLIEEQDFYDLTWQYLVRVSDQHVIHAEIFFDPQSHMSRGIPFERIIRGIHRALEDGRKNLGISTRLVLSLLRHMDESNALKTYEMVLPYREVITAIGLDSSERGNPPSKFRRVFDKARSDGFLTVAHAGEEGPADYVRQALEILQVSRIDHGNHSLDDPELTAMLAEKQIPLTLCPLSNLKLKVVHNLQEHPVKKMMDLGLLVTVNSDDPAYFGGYLNENYAALARSLPLTYNDLALLAKNSFAASFLEPGIKKVMMESVDRYVQEFMAKRDDRKD
jgi:adenine deaminase